MKHLSKLMDFTAKNLLRIVMGTVLLAGLVIKPMYAPLDYPYFTFMEPLDYVLLILLGGCMIFVIKHKKGLEAMLDLRVVTLVFSITAVLFIYLVPLKPFSDMQHVYESAIDFSTMDWENLMAADYWKIFPTNIRLGVLWGILLLPFSKTLATMKILNALFVYLTAFFTAKLCQPLHIKCPKILFTLTLFFLPVIFYINHIYFDLPVLFLGYAGLYVYLKNKNILGAALIFAVARCFRRNALVFLLAIIFDYVFHLFHDKQCPDTLSTNERCPNTDISAPSCTRKQIFSLLIAILAFYLISSGFNAGIRKYILPEEYQVYPSANQFYIGINEEEFGFMDGDFSYDRTMADVWQRMKDYGSVRMTKILGKKILWTWMQGTYQAQRYGMGPDVTEASEKFLYDTPVTDLLLKDEQPIRSFLNSLMRTQYLLLFALMVHTLFRQKQVSQTRVFYYVLTATFLILLLYEMKSRYILHCLPAMMVLAGRAIDEINRRIFYTKE